MIGTAALGILVILIGIGILFVVASFIEGAHFYIFKFIPEMLCAAKDDVSKYMKSKKSETAYKAKVRKERARIRALIESAATK